MKTITTYDPSMGTIKKNGQTYKLYMGVLEEVTQKKLGDGRGYWSPAREVVDMLLAFKEGEVELQDAYGYVMTVMMAYSLSTHK